MTLIEIDDELYARFQAVAAPNESFNEFAIEAARERIQWREREAARCVPNGLSRSATGVNLIGQGTERRNFHDNHD